MEILQKAGRNAEAAFFVRTYMPSQVEGCVQNWKLKLPPKVGQSIANPEEHPDEFPDFKLALASEKIASDIAQRVYNNPASSYKDVLSLLDLDLISKIKEGGAGIQMPQAAAQKAASAAVSVIEEKVSQEEAEEKDEVPQQTMAHPPAPPQVDPVASPSGQDISMQEEEEGLRENDIGLSEEEDMDQEDQDAFGEDLLNEGEDDEDAFGKGEDDLLAEDDDLLNAGDDDDDDDLADWS